jgi:hypothetical protein
MPFDLPAPLAGLFIAAVVWGWTFLATVDWTHPTRTPENR